MQNKFGESINNKNLLILIIALAVFVNYSHPVLAYKVDLPIYDLNNTTDRLNVIYALQTDEKIITDYKSKERNITRFIKYNSIWDDYLLDGSWKIKSNENYIPLLEWLQRIFWVVFTQLEKFSNGVY